MGVGYHPNPTATELKHGPIVMEADLSGERERMDPKLQMASPSVHRVELVGITGAPKLQVV